MTAAAPHDLVIRGGLVVDGTGREPVRADVAITGSTIVAVGDVPGGGAEELDATGLIVTPGFVDLHTHYDGQAIWSERINPSSSHGVTTVVMGNCGVGFAPCRPADRDLLCITMEGVEDIPGVVMREGLTWEWETFPEYLDALEQRPHDIDVAAYVPHSAVRVYVMGERGANREPATDADLERMGDVVREAITAGALGFATTRSSFDRRSDGELVPACQAEQREYLAAAQAVRAAGGGVVQIIPALGLSGSTPSDEFELLREISAVSGQPVTFTSVQLPDRGTGEPTWLDLSEAHAAAGGAPIHPQFFPRPIGVLAGLDLTSNPFLYCPSYQAIAHLPLAERVVELHKPDVRARIIAEEPGEATLPLTTMARQFHRIYKIAEPPDYEPSPELNIARIAERTGSSPAEVAYDLLLEHDGHAILLVTIGNYLTGSLEHTFDYFDSDCAVMGLGDGGAHYGLICDSSYPTTVLTHWARDRPGRRLSLARAVQQMTSKPAAVVGLADRGVIAPGYKADLNVIDHQRLALHLPRVVDDLPGGGRRLDQSASGYRWTIVSGVVIAKDDEPTGVLPGRLVRGRQQAPQLAPA